MIIAMNEQAAKAWQDYARRRRWVCGVLLAGLVIVVISHTLADTDSDFAGSILLFLGLAWIIAYGVVVSRHQLFLCPHCHRQFFNTSWYGNPLGQKCVHCGLPKWSHKP